MRGRVSVYIDCSYSLIHRICFCVTEDVGCLKEGKKEEEEGEEQGKKIYIMHA